MKKEKDNIQDDQIVKQENDQLEVTIEKTEDVDVVEKNNRIEEVEFRLQELEIIIDQLEQKVLEDSENSEYMERFTHAKTEYKTLLKERKSLLREVRLQDDAKVNQVSTWIYFYGIGIFILYLPFVSYSIWLGFASVMIDWLSDAFSNIGSEGFMFYLVSFLFIFSLPLLLLITSWMLYLNLMRKPLDKKAFLWLWVIQGLLSVGMIVYITIQWLGN